MRLPHPAGPANWPIEQPGRIPPHAPLPALPFGRAFAAQHGRPATYEDKKLARDFQQLRAQLRQVDTDLVIERGKLPDMSYEITVRDILSTRRMRVDTSRTAATADTARSGRSVALGASLRDRERSKRHLRSMHSHLAASHRQAKLVAALGADVARTDARAHGECKQLPGYLREAALKRCESSVVDHHQRVYEETARVCAMTLRKAQKSAREAAPSRRGLARCASTRHKVGSAPVSQRGTGRESPHATRSEPGCSTPTHSTLDHSWMRETDPRYP